MLKNHPHFIYIMSPRLIRGTRTLYGIERRSIHTLSNDHTKLSVNSSSAPEGDLITQDVWSQRLTTSDSCSVGIDREYLSSYNFNSVESISERRTYTDNRSKELYNANLTRCPQCTQEHRDQAPNPAREMYCTTTIP